jgi:hypothetical protein
MERAARVRVRRPTIAARQLILNTTVVPWRRLQAPSAPVNHDNPNRPAISKDRSGSIKARLRATQMAGDQARRLQDFIVTDILMPFVQLNLASRERSWAP